MQVLDRHVRRFDPTEREWTDPRGGGRTKPTVLVLGRYNATKPHDWHELTRRHAQLALEFLTVHRSKGLEAD